MKILNLFILFILIPAKLYSQAGCEMLSHTTIPPSPYQEGYMRFDGKGDFLRTQDINELEFNSALTASFSIETRLKIARPYTAMYILGKMYGAGWLLGYHTYDYGYLSISFGSGWKKVFYLGNDTSWHTYRIEYDRTGQTLKTFVDDSLTFTYTSFSYGDLANNGAFSVGNVGFLPNYGELSVNLSSLWFCGSIDLLKIKVNQDYAVNYSFNEGAGQVCRDSASYFISDRVYPGESSYCGAYHFMMGFGPAKDTCDPEWSKEPNNFVTGFSSLGSGMQYRLTPGNTENFAEHFSLGLCVWNGYLINGGKFNYAGGVPANHIAKWDGTSWSAIGGGFNHEVIYMTVYNNDLYATGYFDSSYGAGARNHIARWDGQSWKACGNGFNNAGTVLTVYNDKLIAGGFFNSAGEVYAPGIAMWDGNQWMNMGGGINGVVWALCEYNGSLYAGGSFEFAGGVACNGIAKWDGFRWMPAGSGVSGGDEIVFVLKVYNNELYAGGSFVKMNGTDCFNIARYNGSVWNSARSGAKGMSCASSSGGHIIDLQEYDSWLYVVGQFTEIGGVRANKIAKWNGINWCAVEYGADLRPEDLEVYNGDLIINGDFYSISGIEFDNIAKYEGSLNFTGGNNNQTNIADFSLLQNYPNPFNPETQIEFILPHTGFVMLEVYDVTGRMVSTLVNGTKNKGRHTVSFSAEGFSSGVYFYRLKVINTLSENSYSETKKMLLFK